MKRNFLFLIFTLWFFIAWQSRTASAQTILAQDSWSDFVDETDAFAVSPGNCGIVFYPWKRGSGIKEHTRTKTYFNSKYFTASSYTEAVDSEDYIYFSVKTDPYTSLIINQLSFKTKISKNVDSADIIADYGDLSGDFTFTQIGEYIDTTDESSLYSILPDTPIIVPANDSAVFRLVIATNFGNKGSTFGLFGGSVSATYTVDLSTLTAQISAPDTNYCFGSIADSGIPIVVNGAPGASVFYSKSGAGHSVMLDTTGHAAWNLLPAPPVSTTAYIYRLDSVQSKCYSRALSDSLSLLVYPKISPPLVRLQ